MKFLLAVLTVLAAFVALVVGINAMTPLWPDWAVLLAFALGLVAIIGGAQRVFGLRTGSHPLVARSLKDQIAALEATGQLKSESFVATRCLAVEEAEDEGLLYWLELADGRLLCLTGQYLYDYEPIDDDPELNQSRRFPCTHFTVRSHATDGYTIDILCAGEVLAPIAVLPPFAERVWDENRAPEDRLIISDTLDAVRNRGGAVRAAG